NLEYQGIEAQPVKLNDGIYEGAPLVSGGAARTSVRLAEDLFASGDFDGDGKQDAAVLLTKNSGGSGVLTYLAIVTHWDGQPKNTATVLVGDRVQVRSLRLGASNVMMELVVAGPGEPACCPATKIRKTFLQMGTELHEGASETEGKLSGKDLEGTNWRLVRMGLKEPPLTGTSATAAFQGGRITGSGGCNRYFARVQEAGPGEISIGPAGSTRMACPQSLMKLETDYLHRLERVRKFGFFMGKLALTYEEGRTTDALLFVSEP
ncbi:MAG: hypothetical protein H6R26_1307, partial [Proteobacteria bacterium]|nr:hypothetical protein [Pseudomonadota bacterium]